MKTEIYFHGQGFADPPAALNQAKNVMRLVISLAAKLDIPLQDAVDWLYEGDILTGNETVENLVYQWNNENWQLQAEGYYARESTIISKLEGENNDNQS
jgi:hypothetical protein